MEGPTLLLRHVKSLMDISHMCHGLKDVLHLHLVGIDQNTDSRPILNPLPPPAPGSIFLLFLQYLSFQNLTNYEEIL